MPPKPKSGGLVHMSWSPANLYNLYRLSIKDAQPVDLAQSLSFMRTTATLYQQRFKSRRLLRAYHGDWISERRFRRRFLPDQIPALESGSSTDKGKARGYATEADKIPLGSLMWREVEARLDVLVFRACFAHSAYDARRLVLHGHVKLNGKVCRDPNLLLNPGDLFSVDAKEMYLLRQSDRPFETQKKKAEEPEEPASELAEGATQTSPTEEAEPAEGNVTETEATSSVTAEAPVEASPPAPGKQKQQKQKPKQAEISGFSFDLPDFAAPFIFIPAYLEVSFPTTSAIYVRHPTARPNYSEIPSPYQADGENSALSWEYYKGVGRRRRNLKDHGDVSALFDEQKQFDDKGRRKWGKDWPEYEEESRKMRGVRHQYGKWTNRPV